MMNQLKKINVIQAIDTSDLVKKAVYDIEISH